VLQILVPCLNDRKLEKQELVIANRINQRRAIDADALFPWIPDRTDSEIISDEEVIIAVWKHRYNPRLRIAVIIRFFVREFFPSDHRLLRQGAAARSGH